MRLARPGTRTVRSETVSVGPWHLAPMLQLGTMDFASNLFRNFKVFLICQRRSRKSLQACNIMSFLCDSLPSLNVKFLDVCMKENIKVCI